MYYINDGGPITVSLDYSDIPYTIASLQRFINKVKTRETLVRNTSWMCKMCSFYNTQVCNKAWEDLRDYGKDFMNKKYYRLNIEEQKNINHQ